MKRVALLLAVLTAPMWAQLSQDQRDFLLSNLWASRKLFLDSINGLSQAQWKFKASPEKWSIAEVAEHIAISEDFFRERAAELMKTPAKAVPADVEKRDQELMKGMEDRSSKRQAPEALRPTGRFATPMEAAAFFLQRRDGTLDYARSTQDDLRAHSASTGARTLDAYQWLLVAAGHTERHVAQINEVKADPNFPK